VHTEALSVVVGPPTIVVVLGRVVLVVVDDDVVGVVVLVVLVDVLDEVVGVVVLVVVDDVVVGEVVLVVVDEVVVGDVVLVVVDDVVVGVVVLVVVVLVVVDEVVVGDVVLVVVDEVVPPPAKEMVWRELAFPLLVNASTWQLTPVALQSMGLPPASGTNVCETFTLVTNPPVEREVNVPIVPEMIVVPLGRSADSTRIPEVLAGKPAPVTVSVAGLDRFWPSFGDRSSVTPGWSPDCGVAMATPTPLTVKAMNMASAALWRRAMRFMRRS
jgi:hypothetical protein